MRKSVQKRNTGPERRKERETFCGRLREVDAVSAFPSSTSGYEEKRLEAKTVRGFDVSGQNDRADKTRKA
mgnify:CR=1 FL=1